MIWRNELYPTELPYYFEIKRGREKRSVCYFKLTPETVMANSILELNSGNSILIIQNSEDGRGSKVLSD